MVLGVFAYILVLVPLGLSIFASAALQGYLSKTLSYYM